MGKFEFSAEDIDGDQVSLSWSQTKVNQKNPWKRQNVIPYVF